MARARRAKPRRSRALIALVVVALLAGGVVAALRFWPGSLVAIGPTPAPVAESTPSDAGPSSASTASSAAPSPSASATPTATASPASTEAVRAMESCRERVQAADEVLKQARTGIGHWEAHVGAERAAAKREISTEKRQAIFKATRLQGPDDQRRYADAQRAYDKVRDASCGKAKGADAEVTATLATCRERAVAQGRLMAAAAKPMGDWKSHLAAMQRSREIHVDNAQQVWLEAYKAAPPNINAYEKALSKFDAPRC
jgi:pyruvate/2-oxoglutarate dehydrogenase complex dihydrolipoamide acyltransferase (E2) component